VFGLVFRGPANPPACTRTGAFQHWMKTFFWFVLAICAMVLTGCGWVR
jgi:hypothetical protein